MTAVRPRDFTIAGIACRWQGDAPDALAVARAWLPEVAAGVRAGEVRRDGRGRPRLATGNGDVSWSHTRGRLLLAHAPGATVGVDVEHLSRCVDAMRIARRHFCVDEVRLLQALEGAERTRAFLHLWCAKEAVLKADGRGLAFGLDRVAFRLADAGLRMIACDPALGAPREWRLHAWEPEQDYLAVLAWRDGILVR